MEEESIRLLKGLHEETEYRVRGREDNIMAIITRNDVLRLLFSNISYSAAMRQAAKEREKSTQERGSRVGIELSWRPEDSLPLKSKRQAI